MQCNLNNVTRISGYNQAARYFEETKKPRTVKWGEDERPLYNTRSYHYRIVRGVDFYDLVLYSTPMIRYYKPEANGDSRVLVRGHTSNTSNNFLWYHGFARGKGFVCVDDAGNEREGRLLLNQATHKAEKFGVPRDWSADLMFIGSNGDDYCNRLDLTRSKHIPGYKAASSDEDKAQRKQLKNVVDHWIELLGYRLDEYLNTELSGSAVSWRRHRAGDSFTSAIDLLSYDEQAAIRDAVGFAIKAGDTSQMDGEAFVNAMTQFGHAVATHLQGVKENQVERRWNYQTQTYDVLTELQPVTREDFRKSMQSHLISLLGLREGSARIDIGQFPESIPRRWWC
jgi:hypothetical protein